MSDKETEISLTASDALKVLADVTPVERATIAVLVGLTLDIRRLGIDRAKELVPHAYYSLLNLEMAHQGLPPLPWTPPEAESK